MELFYAERLTEWFVDFFEMTEMALDRGKMHYSREAIVKAIEYFPLEAEKIYDFYLDGSKSQHFDPSDMEEMTFLFTNAISVIHLEQ